MTRVTNITNRTRHKCPFAKSVSCFARVGVRLRGADFSISRRRRLRRRRRRGRMVAPCCDNRGNLLPNLAVNLDIVTLTWNAHRHRLTTRTEYACSSPKFCRISQRSRCRRERQKKILDQRSETICESHAEQFPGGHFGLVDVLAREIAPQNIDNHTCL